jgi:hypothetical protein
MKKSKNKLRMIAITTFSIILVQTLFGFPLVSAGTLVEYAYDNGNPANFIALDHTSEICAGVHFTVTETSLLSSNETVLTRIRFYTGPMEIPLVGFFDTFTWKVMDWNETASQPGSTILASGKVTATQLGWLDIDVGNITVPREFFVGFCNTTIVMYIDDSLYLGRNRVINTPVPIDVSPNFLVRAVVSLPVNLEDLITKLEELEAEVAQNQNTIEELNSTLDSRFNNLTSQYKNVSQTTMEINSKIGVPTSTVFSKLDEILDKLDDLLLIFCPPVGGYVLLPVGLGPAARMIN